MKIAGFVVSPVFGKSFDCDVLGFEVTGCLGSSGFGSSGFGALVTVIV